MSLNLYSFIPEHFFSILTGRLKHLHTELLYEVYKEYQKNVFVIDKEVIVDTFCETIEVHIEDLSSEEELIGCMSVREKANHFIRKFLDTGWLIQEQMMDHSLKISIPDYAIRLMETFEKITRGHQEEFRGRILSVYQNLSGEEGHTYIALQQAYENTARIIDGLKRLNHSIKQYTEKLLQEDDLKQVLEQFFHDYELKVLGPHYYQLKSSDHVSKYRTPILKAVQVWQFDNDRIQTQSEAMAMDKVVATSREGANEIYGWLDFIERYFSQMDDIIKEIDVRNRQYNRAAIQKIKFHLHQTGGLTDKISRVLMHLAHSIQQKGEQAAADDLFQQQIPLFKQEFLDDKSWKYPYKFKPKQKAAKKEEPKTDPERRKAGLNRFLKRVSEEKTVQQINQYVLKQLGDQNERSLADFPLETAEDWVQLIYAITFSTQQGALFRLSPASPEKLERQIRVEGGSVPNRKIAIKENSNGLG